MKRININNIKDVNDIELSHNKPNIRRKLRRISFETKDKKRQIGSEFDYQSAGGSYPPSKTQVTIANRILKDKSIQDEKLKHSASIIKLVGAINGIVHHDHIHRINVYKRNLNSNFFGDGAE